MSKPAIEHTYRARAMRYLPLLKSLLAAPTAQARLAQLCLWISCGVLTACQSTPPEQAVPMLELPAHFSTLTSSATRTESPWWYSFNDSKLNQLIDQALHQNPSLAQALAQQRIAQAQTRIARANLLPQVGLGLGAARQKQLQANLLPPYTPTTAISEQYNAALDISWELDLWGRLAQQNAAARSDYLASSEQLKAVQQSIAAQTAQIYYEIVHAKAQVDLSERTVKTLQEVARQINNRMHVGIASPADAMLANANLGSAEAGLLQRREALEQYLRHLDVLLGQYPSGKRVTAEHLPQVPALPNSGIPADVLLRRPDVRAAEYLLHSRGYQLNAARRSFLPALSFSASAGYGASHFSDLFDGDLIWSIAGQVLQPVFQGGRLIAQVDAATGQRDEAIHSYAETALNALLEVENTLVIEQLLDEREQTLDRAANAAEQATLISQNRYQQGIDPFLNVLESQQRALDGRSAYISAQHARIKNRIAMHLALGDGLVPAATKPQHSGR